jgi:uncharacterized membrane protein
MKKEEKKIQLKFKKKNNNSNYYNFEKNPFFKAPRSIGQKAADFISKWAGSWTFIFLFFLFLGIWMSTNGIFVLRYLKGDLTDPYPFILLNLALSCLAAIQAPIILMSQNRQSQKDRLQAQYDYAVNRKAEKEILEIKRLLMKKEK